jgi:hypothetical protein
MEVKQIMFARFVLRGRPGLGHVIPGLRVARALLERGHRVQVLTYGAGTALAGVSDFPEWINLETGESLRDWPGLHPYDDCLGQLGQLWCEDPASVTVLGGEYLLPGPAARLAGHVVAMINPEIARSAAYNAVRGEILADQLSHAHHLLPLTSVSSQLMAPWRDLLRQAWPTGPIQGALLPSTGNSATPGASAGTVEAEGRLFLISTGGGVAFADVTSSYTGTRVTPEAWIAQTSGMTFLAAQHLLKNAEPGDRVVVFSCLGNEWARWVRGELGPDSRLDIRPISLQFHDLLGQADVLVSRAGAGGIADAMNMPGAAVLWSLQDHQEQLRNLRSAEPAHPVHVCTTSTDLIEALIACTSTRHARTAAAMGSSGTRTLTGVSAVAVAERLEACGEGRCRPQRADDVRSA